MSDLIQPIGTENPPRDCDDYICDLKAPDCLRWFLLVNRLPAIEQWLAERMAGAPKLFADYKGRRVRVVMASRLGDVGITTKLSRDHGYDNRVMVESLSKFSDAPVYVEDSK